MVSIQLLKYYTDNTCMIWKWRFFEMYVYFAASLLHIIAIEIFQSIIFVVRLNKFNANYIAINDRQSSNLILYKRCNNKMGFLKIILYFTASLLDIFEIKMRNERNSLLYRPHRGYISFVNTCA